MVEDGKLLMGFGNFEIYDLKCFLSRFEDSLKGLRVNLYRMYCVLTMSVDIL